MTASPPSSRAPCQACHDHQDLFPFTMAFQPVVDLVNRRIDGYEALVRGPGGEGAPSVLAQVTEENLYAFDQACRTRAIRLASRLGLDRRLSINFLPNAVYNPRACIQATLQAARESDFPLENLTFEILETEHLTETKHLQDIIGEYHHHGFKVALDDFPTGQSGLMRLADLKPDIIKIDRALVQDCDRDQVRRTIIAGIIRIATDLGVKVVIEGVERLEEVRALHAVGGRFFQGFFFARPLFEQIARDGDIDWPVMA
ncbi:diguanylate phosphodiesterase [Gluconacetobacter diazotrophicus PA1 5]|nr:EAL domain-containing protein [Gluconacetobacter diazotrophicus]ACI52096.1 diguanylate phosphodiesterase [Gluconacetobacter diazotrophicus PA1 5]MBB2156970.1 EAL domain-containing protein [Gluconacetobacter diazotrophicus]TWB02805.1 EAL domain-containing protein (putative c-di-GMP-specific phosphodiesterase class I) [Gluconacetobacter diazotrophicus]